MSLFPESIKYSASQLTDYPGVISQLTQNKKWNIREVSPQSFGFTITTTYQSGDSWRELFSFILLLKGQLNTFTVRHPLFKDARGVATGTPLVNGGSQTGSILNIDGLTINTTGIYKSGDTINIAGSNKVYWITSDCDSNGAGQVALPIYPDLQFTPANNSAITHDNVEFTVRLSSPSAPPIEPKPGDVLTYSFSVIEVIS